MWNVAHAVRAQKGSLAVAMTRLVPFILLNGLALFWALHSPSNILSHHPRLILWTTGLLNSKLLVRILLVLHSSLTVIAPFDVGALV